VQKIKRMAIGEVGEASVVFDGGKRIEGFIIVRDKDRQLRVVTPPRVRLKKETKRKIASAVLREYRELLRQEKFAKKLLEDFNFL